MAARAVRSEPPLIVIAGPTASGKTALAIKLAQQYGGEIICADSRTIYKGMDIGTAKPSAQEQATVPHWGLDLVEPGERFSAADFKAYAQQKIIEIQARGHVPFLVGGTGLYTDSVIFDYQFGPQADDELRHRLQVMTIEELQNYCQKNNIEIPENDKNKRYLIRAIEQNGINTTRRSKPIDNIFVVGIATEKETLRTRIVARSEQLFEQGVIEEASNLAAKYGWENEAMTGNIYPLCRQYLAGELTLQQMKEKFVTLDWRLAKRQLTWLKRNPYIQWLNLEAAEKQISSVLAPEH
jgi:tRNA dimethylallyltransferase